MTGLTQECGELKLVLLNIASVGKSGVVSGSLQKRFMSEEVLAGACRVIDVREEGVEVLLGEP